jgi:hypothetical protein
MLMVCVLMFVVSSCAPKSKPADTMPYAWAVTDAQQTFSYWHTASDSGTVWKTDTVQQAMTIEVHDYMITTITRLHETKLTKSELIRRSQRGVMRLLACDDNTIAEQLFIPFPASNGTTWFFKTCTGDTISTFRILAADTTVRVPAGEFRAFVMREVDYTPLTTDTYINEQHGIVKINYLHSVYDSVRQRYTDDVRAVPFEGFVLTGVGKLPKR